MGRCPPPHELRRATPESRHRSFTGPEPTQPPHRRSLGMARAPREEDHRARDQPGVTTVLRPVEAAPHHPPPPGSREQPRHPRSRCARKFWKRTRGQSSSRTKGDFVFRAAPALPTRKGGTPSCGEGRGRRSRFPPWKWEARPLPLRIPRGTGETAPGHRQETPRFPCRVYRFFVAVKRARPNERAGGYRPGSNR